MLLIIYKEEKIGVQKIEEGCMWAAKFSKKMEPQSWKDQESAWRNLMTEGSEMKPCIGGAGMGSCFPLPAQSVEMSPRGKTQGVLML